MDKEDKMDKKYQIFISSTYTDLIEARNKVRDAVLSMMHFPVGMEMFSAADEEQWEIIQDTIDSSDYYILILGHRYGSVIESGDGAGISYTEKEFRYAKTKGIPILAFILSDDADIKKADVESDLKKSKKLDLFKDDVKSGRIVEWWKTPDELAQKVTAALHKQMDRKKRPGWVRGDSFDIEAGHAEILRLNELVRNLQQENEKLKLQVVVREPNLTVSFLEDKNGMDREQVNPGDKETVREEICSHGNLILALNENKVKIKYVPVCAESYRNLFEPLDRSCVDAYLRNFVSNEALKQYNDALPDRDTVDAYIDALEKYQRIYKGGVVFTLQISNDGTAKATDVRVFIDFPEEILLFDVSDVEDMEEPQIPELPPNPIEKAEMEYERRMSPAADFAYPLDGYRPYDVSESRSVLIKSLITSDVNFSNQLMSVEEHGITAEAKQIPHRDLEWFDDIYIVPTVKGSFKIKISIMCSEYLEPVEKYIDFEVV